MITIKIVCVGNLKEKFWKDACDEYKKRLQKHCNLKIVEVGEKNIYQLPEKIVESEGKEILSNIGKYTILLDIKGKTLSSEEFASHLQKLANETSEVTFVIGGSYGVSEQVKNAVNEKISFGKITYPHNLARVILLEQIYRAFMIGSGSKYHK